MCISILTRFEGVLLELLGPLIRRQDVVADLLAGLMLEPRLGLRGDHFLEVAWVDRPNDVEKELAGRPLRGGELVVHVLLDLWIVFDLVDQVLRLELRIVGQLDVVVLVVLEALLLAAPQLADEHAVDLLVRV